MSPALPISDRCGPPRWYARGNGPGTRGIPGWLVQALAAAPRGPLSLALGLPLGDGLPLVVVLAPAGDGDLDLGVAVLEVQGQRDQRDAGVLHLACDAPDLVSLEQQLADKTKESEWLKKQWDQLLVFVSKK